MCFPMICLELPSLVRQLVEAQARTEAAIAASYRCPGIASEARSGYPLGGHGPGARRGSGPTAQEIRELTAAQRRSTDEIGTLTGKMLEWDYKEQAPSYFGPIVRRFELCRRPRWRTCSTMQSMMDD